MPAVGSALVVAGITRVVAVDCPVAVEELFEVGWVILNSGDCAKMVFKSLAS